MSGPAGFFPAPGTDYTFGAEPTLAQRLNALAKAQGLHLTGLSGHRTPSHSIAVGGTPSDPHTKGLASDTPGVENVPESILERFGLTRPMTAWNGRDERDHIQLLPGFKAKGGDGVSIGGVVQDLTGPVGAGLDVIGVHPFGKGAAGDVVSAAGGVAGGVAGDVASAIVKLLANTLGNEGAKILLYLAFVVGGAVLIGMGAARLFGVHPVAAAKKAGAARAALAVAA